MFFVGTLQEAQQAIDTQNGMCYCHGLVERFFYTLRRNLTVHDDY